MTGGTGTLRAPSVRVRHWALGLMVAGLVTLPVPHLLGMDAVTGSTLFAFTQLFLLVVLVSDWNLISGFAGYVDFGHPVFFGLGAYGVGVLMNKLAWPFWAALPIAGVVGLLFALLIGMPTLRLKGPYFSIAMLGTFVAVREIVRVSGPLTGGGRGLTLPPYLNRALFYYLALALALAVVALMWWIRRSQFGATLVAIREDEVGAEMRGIDTTRHKIVAYMVAGLFSGLVGGLWAYENTFIDPDVVFFDARIVELVMMGILGGLGTVAGPVVGATVVYWLRDFVWGAFLQFHLVAQGVLLVAIVLYLPEGIVGAFGGRGAVSARTVLSRWFRWGAEA